MEIKTTMNSIFEALFQIRTPIYAICNWNYIYQTTFTFPASEQIHTRIYSSILKLRTWAASLTLTTFSPIVRLVIKSDYLILCSLSISIPTATALFWSSSILQSLEPPRGLPTIILHCWPVRSYTHFPDDSSWSPALNTQVSAQVPLVIPLICHPRPSVV